MLNKHMARCLSLKRPSKKNPVDAKKTKESDKRFSFDLTVDNLITFQKGEFAVNTAKSTEYVTRNFQSWQIGRNQ